MQRFLLFIYLCIFLSVTSFAQTNTWTGDGDGTNWTDADNWSLDLVPTSAHDVFLTSAATIELTGTHTINSLTLNDLSVVFNVKGSLTLAQTSTSILTVTNGQLINSGYIETASFDVSGAVTNVQIVNNASAEINIVAGTGSLVDVDKFHLHFNSTVDNYGTINSTSTSSQITSRAAEIDGLFRNYGTMNITGNENFTFEIDFNADFVNESSGNIYASSTITGSPGTYVVDFRSDVINKGFLQIDHPTNPNSYIESSGIRVFLNTTFTNTGTTIVNDIEHAAIYLVGNLVNSGTIIAESLDEQLVLDVSSFPSDFNNTGGEIRGNGSLRIFGTISGGTYKPGNSPGIMVFEEYSDLSGKYAEMEIAGNAGPGAAGGHDILEAREYLLNSPVNLHLGDMDVDFVLIDGFVPSLGDKFLVARADGELTGNFGIIGFPPTGNPVWYWDIEYDYVNDEVFIELKSTVVPVELVGFDASAKDEYNELSWSTWSEENSDFFEIQSRTDNSQWTSIGIVDAAFYSNESLDYNYFDRTLTDQRHYYRLKMVDRDGSFSYSHIVSVNRELSASSFSVFPNPFRETFFVNQTGSYMLYDVQGKIVKQLKLTQGQSVEALDLLPGVYTLSSKDQLTKPIKVIKLK